MTIREMMSDPFRVNTAALTQKKRGEVKKMTAITLSSVLVGGLASYFLLTSMEPDASERGVITKTIIVHDDPQKRGDNTTNQTPIEIPVPQRENIVNTDVSTQKREPTPAGGDNLGNHVATGKSESVTSVQVSVSELKNLNEKLNNLSSSISKIKTDVNQNQASQADLAEIKALNKRLDDLSSAFNRMESGFNKRHAEEMAEMRRQLAAVSGKPVPAQQPKTVVKRVVDQRKGLSFDEDINGKLVSTTIRGEGVNGKIIITAKQCDFAGCEDLFTQKMATPLNFKSNQHCYVQMMTCSGQSSFPIGAILAQKDVYPVYADASKNLVNERMGPLFEASAPHKQVASDGN